MLLPIWSLVLAIGVEDVPNPRVRASWVSDTANIIPAEAEARLERLLEQIHEETSAEVTVVTVDNVSGTPKHFATALFNHWGVGSAERHDGVLFLMVMSERRLEIEVGYGLESTLSQGWLGTMQTANMIPRFKAGDFPGGLEVGVIEVGKHLGARIQRVAAIALEHPNPVEHGSPVATSSSSPSDSGPPKPSTPWWAFGLALSGGLGLLGGGVRGVRVFHHKRCRTCKLWRRLLCEVEEDVHLDAGQEREEELGSVDYDVYVCCMCSSVSVMAKRGWLSGYGRCGSCTYRTMTTKSRTVTPATTSSTGKAEVTETCHHCSHHSVSYVTIPRIEETSSSSSGSSYGGGSSGGGSFGGGSSGGGGAGSSW